MLRVPHPSQQDAGSIHCFQGAASYLELLPPHPLRSHSPGNSLHPWNHSMIYWKPDATKACAWHFLCRNLFHNSTTSHLNLLLQLCQALEHHLKSHLSESHSLNWSITSFALVFIQKLLFIFISHILDILHFKSFFSSNLSWSCFLVYIFDVVAFLNNPCSLWLPPALGRGIDAWVTWYRTGPLPSENARQDGLFVQCEHDCRQKHISTCHVKTT